MGTGTVMQALRISLRSRSSRADMHGRCGRCLSTRATHRVVHSRLYGAVLRPRHPYRQASVCYYVDGTVRWRIIPYLCGRVRMNPRSDRSGSRISPSARQPQAISSFPSSLHRHSSLPLVSLVSDLWTLLIALVFALTSVHAFACQTRVFVSPRPRRSARATGPSPHSSLS
ncbi:hypothetical protein BJV74DRAFT_577971 [Russula compacta]|nr:hypothetical protein BJV74DRAFT_577971 [Russula compacta]